MFMRRRFQKCCCMNNNYNDYKNDVIEDKCDNKCSCKYADEDDDCACGFDDTVMPVLPENPMLAQSYVPYQYMDKTFRPCFGLKMGTIFPELVSPYEPGQSMAEIDFIKCKNSIGEGCNK